MAVWTGAERWIGERRGEQTDVVGEIGGKKSPCGDGGRRGGSGKTAEGFGDVFHRSANG